MEASTSVRQSIIEHYKGDDVFQRSEEFYQQLLNSRKPNQPISQSAYQSSYQQSSVVQKNSTYNTTYVSPPTFNTQYNSNTLNVPQNISPAYQTIGPAPTFILPQPPGPISPPNNVMQPIPEMSLANSSFSQGGIETSAAIKGNSNQHISPEVQAAIEENNALNVELERLTKGDADFGNSDSVIKMSYYSLTQAETKQIQYQYAQINKLNETITRNNKKIDTMKRAASEIEVRMNNIQSVDKEIYKNLQNSVNRDKELLEKAASALARGEKREDVSAILEQIITS